MNPRRQALVAALGAIIVTVLFFVFALRPKLTQIGEVRDEIEQAQTEQRRLEAELKQLQQAQDERPRTIARLALANRYVPTEPDLPGFIRLVQTAATDAGVTLQSIAPSPPRDLEGARDLQIIDVTLTVQGGFFRLEDLLVRLEGLERLVEVRSLAVTPQSEGLSDQTTLNTSISLLMYVAGPEARFSGGTVSSSSSSSSSDAGASS